jgi:hypothetical protein
MCGTRRDGYVADRGMNFTQVRVGRENSEAAHPHGRGGTVSPTLPRVKRPPRKVPRPRRSAGNRGYESAEATSTSSMTSG